jgi:hypothetical protein
MVQVEVVLQRLHLEELVEELVPQPRIFETHAKAVTHSNPHKNHFHLTLPKSPLHFLDMGFALGVS